MMPPRPRKPGFKDLPTHLRWDGRTYRFRTPDGVEHGMGTDKAKAINAANTLNARFYPAADLVDQVLGSADSIPALVKRYDAEFLSCQDYAAKTLEDKRGLMKRVAAEWANVRGCDLDLATVSTFINSHPPRMARVFKSNLSIFFRYCVGIGAMYEDLTRDVLLNKAHKVKRERLTLEAYKAIRAKAPAWFQNAMDVALHSLQREEDLTRLKFDDVRDGYLEVIQQKTGAAVRIKIEGGLDKAIRASRDNVLSPFIIHYQPQRITQARKAMDHHTQLTGDQLSREFKAARVACKLFDDWEPGTAPSFHEIRALGAQLYQDAGIDPQWLLGHRDAETTKIYLDKRRIEWIEAIGGIPGL